MRKLNRKQEKLLREWFNDNWGGVEHRLTVADVPQKLYDELERINDHETIHQNISRFIEDMIMERAYSTDKEYSFTAVKNNPAKFVGKRATE